MLKGLKRPFDSAHGDTRPMPGFERPKLQSARVYFDVDVEV